MYGNNYGNNHGNNRGGGRGGGFNNQSFSPVNVGEEYDVNIEAVGEKGDGIARIKGFVLFVPGVREGDNVRVRITKVLRKVGFAEKIGEAQAPVQGTRQREPEMQPEPETHYEDTEDFGEEPVAEEAPAEEENSEEDLPPLEDATSDEDLPPLEDAPSEEENSEEMDIPPAPDAEEKSEGLPEDYKEE